MSLEIRQFNFQGRNPIRAFERDGETWFVALDACRVLDHSNTSMAIARLDTDEKDEVSIADPIGRYQQTAIINESGLYHLIFTSRKPEAEVFRKWVTSEVLPAVRKTGAYLAKPMTQAEIIALMAQQNVEMERKLTEHEQRLADVETRQTAIEKGTEYYTIVAFANRIGRRITNNQALDLGKYAGRYSRKHEYPIGQANDARYGHVNTYHCEVLEAVFGVKD